MPPKSSLGLTRQSECAQGRLLPLLQHFGSNRNSSSRPEEPRRPLGREVEGVLVCQNVMCLGCNSYRVQHAAVRPLRRWTTSAL